MSSQKDDIKFFKDLFYYINYYFNIVYKIAYYINYNYI